MLMRCQEIQESKIRRIQHIEGRLRSRKVLTLVRMGIPPILINTNTIEEKLFKPFNVPQYEVILKNDTPSKFFSKPKNNFKR